MHKYAKSPSSRMLACKERKEGETCLFQMLLSVVLNDNRDNGDKLYMC